MIRRIENDQSNAPTVEEIDSELQRMFRDNYIKKNARINTASGTRPRRVKRKKEN
jgi:hypothetical protein